MIENRLIDYLDHMAQAAYEVCGFVDGFAKEDFLADKRTQQAVTMNLIIVGEAVTKVMDVYAEFALSQAQVPCVECVTASRMVTLISIWKWSGTQCNQHFQG